MVKEGIDCIVIDGRRIGLGSTCASTSLLKYEIDTPLVALQKKIGLHPALPHINYVQRQLTNWKQFYNPEKRDNLLPKKTRQLSNDFKKLFGEMNLNRNLAGQAPLEVRRTACLLLGVIKNWTTVISHWALAETASLSA